MKHARVHCFVAGLALAVICSGSAAVAGDDHHGPSGDSVCDELSGAAFGLCNAFCVAQRCQVESKHSCDVLRENFRRKTGRSTFPCETGAPSTATPTRTPAANDETPTATRTRPATPTRTDTRLPTVTRTIADSPPATATATIANGVATATRTAVAEDVCVGLEDGAHGLCNAFCNAQHCQRDPHFSCEVLRRNFFKQTGSSVFPCETVGGTPTATPDEDVCLGDCNGDRSVTIDDLTTCTAIALGKRARSECLSTRTHALTIADLVLAVRHALDGCR